MLFLPRYLCAFVQVATCADIDMHGIDTAIPAIEYTTIPANKGADGAVSVRERAVNEAALAVCFAPVSHGVFVCGCVFVVQRPASRLPCRCPRSLFPYARMAGFRSPLRGGPMPRPP